MSFQVDGSVDNQTIENFQDESFAYDGNAAEDFKITFPEQVLNKSFFDTSKLQVRVVSLTDTILHEV